jgi:hypothetical protein
MSNHTYSCRLFSLGTGPAITRLGQAASSNSLGTIFILKRPGMRRKESKKRQDQNQRRRRALADEIEHGKMKSEGGEDQNDYERND